MRTKSSCLSATQSFLPVLIALVVGFVGFAATIASSMPIVKDGKPTASIQLAPDTSEEIREVVTLLQDYLEKSTGAVLPIDKGDHENTLFIGKHPDIDVSKLDEEGFILQHIDPHTFVITGATDWGIEYGIYDVLERYVGVRWLMATSLGTDIPEQSSIDIPDEKIVEEPTFLFRHMSPTGQGSLRTWGQFNKVFRNGPSRMGFHHNLLNLFPASVFAETNPEFYPILDGERFLPIGKEKIRWQPNLSAPGIVDAAVKRIDEYFQENPDQPTYSLGMNDSNNWDQSPESLARRSGQRNVMGYDDVSDDYFEWANKVVEKVLKKYPDKWFGTLAYNGLASPPTRVDVHSHIVPFITYDRMRWSDPELREIGQQLTKDWSKMAPTLGWYGYDYGRSYLLPRVYFHEMQEYLSWGAANHVKYHYSELYPNWGEGPKAWIFAKLLWNPEQDVDALLQDWYTHFAGEKAAPELARFYEIWEKFWTETLLDSKWNTKKGQYLPFNTSPGYLIDVTDEMLADADRAMSQAMKLSKTSAQRARVAKLNEMWDFYRASIISFRASRAVSSALSEADALGQLDRAAETLALAQRRQDLLKNFEKDPLFSSVYHYIHPTTALNWDQYSSAEIWQSLPWMKKSAAVRDRVQAHAKDSSGRLQQQAQLLLKASEGKAKLLTQNESFEDGRKGWVIWDKAGESAEFARGTWTITSDQVASGKSSFSVQGIGRGGIYQHISYAPGDYYVRVCCYIPKQLQSGKVRINLTARGVDSKTSAQWGLPQQELTVQAGEWNEFIVPFRLPKSGRVNEETKISAMFFMGEFAADEIIYVDDMGIYRLEADEG